MFYRLYALSALQQEDCDDLMTPGTLQTEENVEKAVEKIMVHETKLQLHNQSSEVSEDDHPVHFFYPYAPRVLLLLLLDIVIFST